MSRGARRAEAIAIDESIAIEATGKVELAVAVAQDPAPREPPKKFTDAWLAALRHEDPKNPKEREWADAGCPGLVLVLTKKGTKIFKFRDPESRSRASLGSYPALSLKLARAAVKCRNEGVKTRWAPYTAVLHAVLDALALGAPVTPSMAADARNALRGIEAYEPPSPTSAASNDIGKVPVPELVEDYLKSRRGRWAKTTFVTKASSCRMFAAWAETMTAADITAGSLDNYHTVALNRPRRVKAKGGKRGETRATTDQRSPVAINNELKMVRMMLQALRKAKRLPNIESSDEINDNLQTLTDNRQPPRPLKTEEIQTLLDVSLRHDAEAGAHQIAPFVVFMLLSGIRLGEALKLTWEDVLFDQELINVPASKAKMGRPRDVVLQVCPTLLRLLRALRVSASSGTARIFEGLTKDIATTVRKDLVKAGVTDFLWSTTNTKQGGVPRPTARATCGSYLASAPGINGGNDASDFFASKQLGHRMEVGQKHYYVPIRGVPKKAKTVEAAMGIQREVGLVIAQVEQANGRALRLVKPRSTTRKSA